MLTMIVTCLISVTLPWDGHLLADLPVRSASDRSVSEALPSGVSIQYEAEATRPGQGAFSITNSLTGPVWVPLFRVPLQDPGKGILFYRTRVRSVAPDQRAFLEIRCTYPGGDVRTARLNSSALNETTVWSEVETPFYLTEQVSPTAVTLGVAFEGPGTVWVGDGVLLHESRMWGRYGFGYMLSLGLITILIGMWSAPVSYHSKRHGRKSRFVRFTLYAWSGLAGLLMVMCVVATATAGPMPLRLCSGVGGFVVHVMAKTLSRQLGREGNRFHFLRKRKAE